MSNEIAGLNSKVDILEKRITALDKARAILLSGSKLPAGHLESRMRIDFHKRTHSNGFAQSAQGSNVKAGHGCHQRPSARRLAK
jgi:hypothetical protein